MLNYHIRVKDFCQQNKTTYGVYRQVCCEGVCAFVAVVENILQNEHKQPDSMLWVCV